MYLGVLLAHCKFYIIILKFCINMKRKDVWLRFLKSEKSMSKILHSFSNKNDELEQGIIVMKCFALNCNYQQTGNSYV